MNNRTLRYSFLVIFFFIFMTSLFIASAARISDDESTLIWEKDGSGNSYQKLDRFGVVMIYNLTVDRTSAEIGENVTVSTVYSLHCNPGYHQEYGMIGIDTPTWFEYRNRLVDGATFHNITEVIPIVPNHFDGDDICKGRVKIKIFNMSDPMDFVIYSNQTANEILLEKAQLNYSLIEQTPLIPFSHEILNLSIFIVNEHSTKYAFSNSSIRVNVSNGANAVNFSGVTDSNGHLNFTINCSQLGGGNYTASLENAATDDYSTTPYSFQLEVFDEDTSINCSLLNAESIYANVDYDSSNFTKAFFLIESAFEANVSYVSAFDSGNCTKITKIGNLYLATLNSPSIAGTYGVSFVAQPLLGGADIAFNHSLEVRRRPTELNVTFTRYENQEHITCQINVTDLLADHAAVPNGSISMMVRYNDSNWEVGPVQCDSQGVAEVVWTPPTRIQEAYLSLQFRFNATQVYQTSFSMRNVTVARLEYSGPLQVYVTKEFAISAVVFALNGTPLPNHNIKLVIDGVIFNLTTNLNGAIYFSTVAPPHTARVRLEFQILGVSGVLPANKIVHISIELDSLHQIWDSLGYMLLGFGVVGIAFLYAKKKLTGRNLATL